MKPTLSFNLILFFAIVGLNAPGVAAQSSKELQSAKSKKNQIVNVKKAMAKDKTDYSEFEADDLKAMIRGRRFFGKGQLDQALVEYNKVSDGSDFWLQAVEEKAHVMGRKGAYNETISLLQTVTANTFNGVISSEPYFVLALTHLKICDYTSVFNTTKKFKENFSGRVESLNQIASMVSNLPVISELIAIGNKDKRWTRENIGHRAKVMPLLFQRDSKLRSLISQPESKKRDDQILKRFKYLAKRDLKEIDVTINKLQIIEADVIQRIYLAEKSNLSRDKLGEFKNSKDFLQFPDNGEEWLDELNGYAAQVEKCPATVRRASI